MNDEGLHLSLDQMGEILGEFLSSNEPQPCETCKGQDGKRSCPDCFGTGMSPERLLLKIATTLLARAQETEYPGFGHVHVRICVACKNPFPEWTVLSSMRCHGCRRPDHAPKNEQNVPDER